MADHGQGHESMLPKTLTGGSSVDAIPGSSGTHNVTDGSARHSGEARIFEKCRVGSASGGLLDTVR
jgi:hypothetical protein